MAAIVLLCGGLLVFKFVRDNTTLSFNFLLDGKPLSVGMTPTVKVDGLPFTSGCTIAPGRHELTAELPNAESFALRVRVLYGNKNLGVLPLESSKGSLLVSANPYPASVIVRQGIEIIGGGAAPFTLEKLALGDYDLEIKHGEYKEVHHVKVQGKQRTEAKISLNLGGVELSSAPADADYEFSGNGRNWQGKLPIKIDDLPIGIYYLVAKRNGWILNENITIVRGSVTTNNTEFPYGSIELTSEPTGLIVSTKGVEIGRTPLTLLEFKPGQYKFAITDNENDLMADVSVAPKEVAKHFFAFHYGAVQLSSTPVGATVLRKGKEVGKTPLTLDHIPAGETMVELRLQDYASTNYVIHALEGGTPNLSAKLISKQYLAYLNAARQAANSSPSDYRRALESINQALHISGDEAEALHLRKDYEFEVTLEDASAALENKNPDVALEKINAALTAKPASNQAIYLKYKIEAAKKEHDKLAAAQAEQVSAERIVAVGRGFDQTITRLVQKKRGSFLIADVVTSQAWEWKDRITSTQARNALLRSIELCSPKWRVATENNPASDVTVIYLHPRGFLVMGDLVVQICQLPNNTVDVHAEMVMGVIQDQNQARYTQNMADAQARRFHDFREQYSNALETVLSNPAPVPAAAASATVTLPKVDTKTNSALNIVSTTEQSRSINKTNETYAPNIPIASIPAPAKATNIINDPVVKKICESLEESNPGKVIQALKKLRGKKASEAVPRILPCLTNSNPGVIREACRTLAILGNKDIISAIEPLLTNPRSDIRGEAHKAIAKLRAKS